MRTLLLLVTICIYSECQQCFAQIFLGAGVNYRYTFDYRYPGLGLQADFMSDDVGLQTAFETGRQDLDMSYRAQYANGNGLSPLMVDGQVKIRYYSLQGAFSQEIRHWGYNARWYYSFGLSFGLNTVRYNLEDYDVVQYDVGFDPNDSRRYFNFFVLPANGLIIKLSDHIYTFLEMGLAIQLFSPGGFDDTEPGIMPVYLYGNFGIKYKLNPEKK